MSTARVATVAPVLASSATAAFPPASRSAMIPEPMTAAQSSSAPNDSAKRRRTTSGGVAARPADRVEPLLQFQVVERSNRKRDEDLDSVL